MASTSERVALLESQLAELTQKFELVNAAQDGDSGIAINTYSQIGDVVSNNPVTVTNTTKAVITPGGSMIQFSDARGKRWLLAPGASVAVIGVTKGMQRQQAKGYLSIA